MCGPCLHEEDVGVGRAARSCSSGSYQLGGRGGKGGAAKRTKANGSFLVFKLGFWSKRKGLKSRHYGERKDFKTTPLTIFNLPKLEPSEIRTLLSKPSAS